mgnify:CR=1 FL=1
MCGRGMYIVSTSIRTFGRIVCNALMAIFYANVSNDYRVKLRYSNTAVELHCISHDGIPYNLDKQRENPRTCASGLCAGASAPAHAHRMGAGVAE